ncbi:MAG TPA: NACHT domain-containing protein [Rhodopseudomonas sp.]|uniref:NACHT domain-containing protein n=1 Tax=Rhodopseudomonas sp. TaxID=1078 RepID=UPI002ED962DD
MIESTGLAATVTAKVFSDLFSKLTLSVLSQVGSKLQAALTRNGSSFEAHLRATFDRCTKIKTLLNRDEPVELLDQYVNLQFKCDEKTVDDYDVIDAVWKKRRVVVSGTGGGGKTIFMKYLWISLFENSRGRIPVFVELRRLNDVSIDKLDVFIYHSIIGAHSSLSESAFAESLRDGAFILILDGFDEIVAAKRISLERQILDLAQNNPALTIVVSGRWDERFNAWQSFTTYHVQPLDRTRVVELIKKLKYEAVIKRKFIERIKRDLYVRHKSFLSSPLLATMMLLTFDQFADIPEKIHLFYEQAFDTLFAKHDATKEAFKRTMYTELSIDVFKRHLAYFCLATYYDEKFEFNETELLVYISKCLKIESSAVSASSFLQDLVESVCILQKEGLNYSFTHRSFQEFFAAYCMARVTSNHLDEVLHKILRRPTDNVVKMLYDINQEMLVGFIRRNLSALATSLSMSLKSDQFLYDYLSCLGVDLKVGRFGREIRLVEDRSSSEANFINFLRKIYPERLSFSDAKMRRFHKKDGEVIRRFLRPPSKGGVQGFVKISFASDASFLGVGEGAKGDEKILTTPWITELGYAEYCREEAEGVVALLSYIDKQQIHKTKAIDDLLGIGWNQSVLPGAGPGKRSVV